MQDTGYRAIAIVGTGAVLPDAPNVAAFWKNITTGRYSVSEVPPDRWKWEDYYDTDRKVPDKTYSKIGGWVREFPWEPLKWRLPIPPRVSDAMDDAQRWAISCTREALADYGYPDRPLDTDRTAVILGNAMGGEKHYHTVMRAHFPEYANELDSSATFAGLPEAVRRDIKREWHNRLGGLLPPITEDTMPGELSNCIAGRIANLYNFHGANFVCDAACASTMAAISAAVDGLIENQFDVVVTGGVDRNMSPSSFVKFCKIGALSATGTRPYAEGADGFIMGEGAAVFLMKRLADAERDGDKIYAVLRGISGSSDGKGKGITAPNPIGQKICIERAWQTAGLSPVTATLIEGHGTSTSVGDVVEVESMIGVLREQGVNGHSIALGSVKSNFGHLKSAAAAAAILKTVLSLREKVLPPSVGCAHPNPNIDFAHSPLAVNTELRPWTDTVDGVRRAGVSAFGFGGTNFHAVLEEYVPHRISGNGKRSVAVGAFPPAGREPTAAEGPATGSTPAKAPLRGALVAGAASGDSLAERLRAVQKAAEAGRTPAVAAPLEADLRAPERVAIDYGNPAELADKCGKALKALAADQPAVWKALRAQGIFRGHGPAPKVAFLYTGQGSQYANMMRGLRDVEPIVADTFAEADRIMTPLLGKPLSEYIFVDSADAAKVAQAEEDLRQTEITQPAVLAIDLALTRLLDAYGIRPDMTMGHSLGEYGALVAAGALPFADSLEAVSARGRGMTQVAMADNGRMAAVFAPLAEVERILGAIDGYVVIANYNSEKQSVIGGASGAVEQAMAAFLKAGFNVVPLPVSHAFHTTIVGGASEPLKKALDRLRLAPAKLPVVANVDGEFYPSGADARPAMLNLLGRQVASPVQFIKGLRTLFNAGARVFVEVGPKKALHGFVEDILGDRSDVLALFTNHPKFEDTVAFNNALCGLYASGLGAACVETEAAPESKPAEKPQTTTPVVITGASLGLPGTEHIFDDGNVARMLAGEQFISAIPARFREAMLDKHITRLMKSDNGGPTFEEIRDTADVIKLAARGREFDLARKFGVSAERVAALDRVTQLAMAAGIDALRDAGIPLTMRYKTTTTGTQLPERWGLPDALRDDTGVIFASVFPGYDSLAGEMERYYSDRARREQLSALEQVRDRMNGDGGQPARQEIERRIAELKGAIEQNPYHFDRRFLFHVLSMGHSQFAELIGARGPNTQVNCACASTTLAVGLAEDWIHAGRCRRVIVISADDITSDHLIEWFGAGFLASGAAATDEVVEEAALPFDRRRHGMILGMGAAAIVVESAEAARERGLQPICEVLAAVTANSAFHGTRLDVGHIGQVMETLVSQAEARGGVRRDQMAPNTVFISHETYTPARGGSASAEIHALRRIFGDAADSVVIANTKGFTGHAMGTGIEDVVAVKALETGCVPPVANFKEIDPELGALNLSKGGQYPVEFALRLGAGFGSQISMTLLRRVGAAVGRPAPDALGYAYRITDQKVWQQWLDRIAGRPAHLEVVQRTLRVHDPAVPVVTAKPAAKVEKVEKPVVEIKPTAPVKAVAAAQTAPAGDAVKVKLLDLVAEKTGYPKDMLALDLDLEADLGVDTVKQAEMFAAIREAYGIPRDPNMKLRDFPTLGHVIQFVYDHRPELQVKAAVRAPAQADDVRQKLLDLVAEKTGYPKDMLALDLDLEADLGVDTVKQAEMFAAIREAYGIPRDPNMKLRDFPTLGHVIQFVYDHRPDLQVKAAAPAPVAAPAAQTDDVKQKLLDLVAEKTGYPKDMLALDLDLEADLGVDTVKQAEMFAAIREAYSIPRDPNMKLRDFPTLGHVIQFVYDHRPELQVKAAAPVPTPAPVAQTDDVKQKLLDLVAEKTGYPKDMLALDLDLEADLGVDTVKQAEMFAAIREAYGIPRDPNMKLRDFPTLGHVIQFVYDHRPELQVKPTALVAARAAQTDDVKLKLLDLVAEKTGYPKDMLALDLDLEADLGVDTVKQAEMFAAIREAYGIPRDPNMKLRDFPTLGHVIQFVYDHRPALNPAAPAPVVAAAVPPPQPAAADDDDAIREKVLDIVAEKTGYPKDMLDPDLDLEADLGIDTVKQAEMFASVRAAFDIPRDQAMKLRDFPTLGHVVRFALEKRTVAAVPASPEPAPAPVRKPAPVVLANFEACERIPRRVPVPALRPALDRCKPTGVVLGSGKRVLVVADRGGAGDALAEKLRALGVEVLGLDQLAAGPVDGVYWLPALDHEGDLKQMSIETWRVAIDVRVKSLYRTMRSLYGQIAAPGTFLVSATRLGGRHGYDDAGADSPLGGAVTGFTKTYKREQPDVLVKAVDFETGRAAADIADLLLAETLRDPGAVEVGHAGGERWTVGLEERPAGNGEQGMTLDKNTVFVVTGAAGSIVSAITTDLAKASGGTFHLLDLIPEPDPSNPDLKRFVTDKDGLKRDLFARIQARGERATPALVERELAGLERAQAAQTAIDAVRAAGGTVYYYGVNMTDGEAVARVIASVRERSGRIDVLLHAAGIEHSHALPDKDPREFDLVFDVKSDGCFHLLRAIGDMPLRSIVGFSSIAGRFGNAGQTDYSAANDLFCKIASSFRTTRPATRALAIDWTAWGGIGMATRGSIPKVMEMAGIDMLPPEAGLPWIRRELTTGGPDGEVVVAGKLGVLLKEWDKDGGLEQSSLPRGPMTCGTARMDLNGRLTIETSLDPAVQGFLRDHAIDGTPLLPGVMGIEAFAETALAIAPGWHVEAVEDVDFLAPLKFYRTEQRAVTVAAEFHPENGGLVARCGLTGERSLPNQASPQVTTHFTGRVRLAKTPRETAAGPIPGSLNEPPIQAADIYRLYFHGPAYQVLKRAWCTETGAVGEFAPDLPEHHQPGDLPLAIAPRLIELCFQTAGLWEMAVKHRMGLPRHVDSVWLSRTPQKADGPLYAVVTADPAAECFAADVVDAAGTRYLHLSGYRTVTLRENVDAPLIPIAEPVMLNA